MKATINENGVLIVEAETPTECYALGQWWRCYPSQYTDPTDVPQPRSSLRVQFEIPKGKQP